MTNEIREELARDFLGTFDAFSGKVHLNAKGKGWWDPVEVDAKDIDGNEIVAFIDRNDGEMVALIHSEASEALEGLRGRNPPSDKIPEFSSVEEELADIVIRCMDLARARGHRLGEAMLAKHKYNCNRSYKHGGKAF